MRYLAIVIAMLSSWAANATSVRYEISGVITSVSAPPYDPSTGLPTRPIENPFAVGQQISGWYEINLDNKDLPKGPFFGGPFFGIVTYLLNLGPVQFGNDTLGDASTVETELFDGENGSADEIFNVELIPLARNNPAGFSLFDDLAFSFLDPTGTGLNLGEGKLDLDKFTTGLVGGSGGVDGFSGIDIGGTVSLHTVPEPSSLLLMSLSLGLVLVMAGRRRQFAAGHSHG